MAALPATSDTRLFVRSIVKRVHPDLFPNNYYERQINAESLKLLNVYLDKLKNRERPSPVRLEFHVKGGEEATLTKISAFLSGNANLAPLFYAFGLIDHQRLQQEEAAFGGLQPADDRDLFAFLHETVTEALQTAQRHETIKLHIRKMRLSLEDRFKLSSVHVGAEFAASFREQEREVEVLQVLDQTLSTMSTIDCEGVSLQLYHPEVREARERGVQGRSVVNRVQLMISCECGSHSCP